MSLAPDNRPTPPKWAWWWLWLWAAVTAVVVVTIFKRPFHLAFIWWAAGAGVLLGGLEAIGLSGISDRLPSLTQIIRQYVPRSVAFTLIYGITALATAKSFHVRQPWRLAAIVALLGFLTTHFDVTFDEDKTAREREKYQRLYQAARRAFVRRQA